MRHRVVGNKQSEKGRKKKKKKKSTRAFEAHLKPSHNPKENPKQVRSNNNKIRSMCTANKASEGGGGGGGGGGNGQGGARPLRLQNLKPSHNEKDCSEEKNPLCVHSKQSQ